MSSKQTVEAKKRLSQFKPPHSNTLESIVQAAVRRKLQFYDANYSSQEQQLDKAILENVLVHYETHGWAIYPQLYSNQQCQNVLSEMNSVVKQYSSFDFTKPSTWNAFPFALNGFVELYHLHSLYQMRFYEKMVQFMTVLYEDVKLRVIIDRCNCKRSKFQPLISDEDFQNILSLPLEKQKQMIFQTKERPDWNHLGFWHHDANLITGQAPMDVQCVVSLADTEEDMGGWQGIDKFHWFAKEWAQKEPNYSHKLQSTEAKIPVRLPFADVWEELHGVHPAMKQGDVMVWKKEVAHGNGNNVNKLGKLRMAAYINFVQAEKEDSKERMDQLLCWQTGKHPGRLTNSESSKWEQIEKKIYQQFELISSLQEKLIGFSEYE